MTLTFGLALFSEVLMIGSALCIAVGWYFIRRHRVATHRALMLIGSALGVGFFISYALRTLLIGDTTFGGPKDLNSAYLIFLQSHATLATVAGVLGVITLRYALRSRFRSHRRVAPWTATLWLIAAASGLVVFLLLYVIFAPGPTTNVINAVVGR